MDDIKNNYSAHEVEDLRLRLAEAEETLRAIQNGEVDAVVVNRDQESQVFTLKGADYAYRVLIEEMIEGVVVLTPDRTIFYSNTQMASILKTPLEDMIGKSIDEFISPNQLQKCQIPSEGGMDSRCKEETVIRAADGTMVPVQITFRFVERINGFYMVVNDITPQKESEKELKNILDDLKRSNEELERFAYVASHDLQEPLRTIASFTQLLERRYKGHLDEDADEFMDYIVEAAIRMKKQIEGLLEFSRVATKGNEFQKVNMDEVLERTINSLNSLICECNADITYDDLPLVMGDPGQLQRVFQNFISNALKFRKYEEPLKIHISANNSEDGKEYVFSIQDNGIGMEAQYFERIFTIFQRLHTIGEYNGTGIGLSIVKRIIERHGGRVWVESKFGKGSTFYFTLPKIED
ncbi:MAG: sensor histidine kinase [Methanobacterium sp.]